MSWLPSHRFPILLSSALAINIFLAAFPPSAASTLSSWVLGADGVLRLRTVKGAQLKAYFQEGSGNLGDRLWIDFPGETNRSRIFKGSGPIRQIRFGKPKSGLSRLVIEFNRFVSLDPSELKLIGKSPETWELDFLGLPKNGLIRIGEDKIYNSNSVKWSNRNQSTNRSFSSSKLPSVRRNSFIVVLDPGHGGPDPGAVGSSGLRESDVVLDIALEVERLLTLKGVDVKLTRRREIDLDLPPRVAMANRINADLFVSIHANSQRNPRKDVNGIETFYYSGSKGLRLSKNIQKEVLKVSPNSPDRGVRRGRFFVIRRTHMPAALVETGFISGRLDGKRLAQSFHRRKLAYAIAKGILNYLKEVS